MHAAIPNRIDGHRYGRSRTRWQVGGWSIVLMTTVALCGCKKNPTTTAAGSDSQRESGQVASAVRGPATNPAQKSPARLATTQRLPAYMVVDQRRYAFPPARMVCDAKDGRAVVTLYSDDPRTALDSTYSGNSFYLQMDVELPDGSTLDGAHWVYRAPQSQRSEGPTGVFLDGQHWQLQPLDVSADFGPQSPGVVTVIVQGTFLMFDATNDADRGVVVQLGGKLDAEVLAK
jgi:hypothetical protein